MIAITSRQNLLYKRLQRLAKGQRNHNISASLAADIDTTKQSAIMLEGVHLGQEWLKYRGQPWLAIIAIDGMPDADGSINLEAENLPSEIQEMLVTVAPERQVAMSRHLLKSLSKIAANQGVLFIAGVAPQPLPKQINQPTLWLDTVQDPGNVGTLIRTAAAAGCHEVMLSEGCAHAWMPRVLRASQGAHFALTIYENVDLSSMLHRLTIPLYATAVNQQAINLYDMDLRRPCVWLFGNEGVGVTPALLQQATEHIYMPQHEAVESLNVSVAAAICLCEQRRQQTQLKRPAI